jgi:RNA polymerase-binding transcription factor
MNAATTSFHDALTAEFRRRLVEARAELFRTIGLTDADLETLRDWEPGAPPEHATSETAFGLLSGLERQEKHRLDEITDALLRLEGGTYGVCQECRRAIPLARLRAMPAARLCVACQARTEHRG